VAHIEGRIGDEGADGGTEVTGEKATAGRQAGATERENVDARTTAVARLECPVCEAALRSTGLTLVCANGHSFDVAKEGYVNLLPPQHRSRGIEGDVREMLDARRRFLDAGYFDPLRDSLAEEVRTILSARTRDTGPPCVIEVGCGEGTYIGAIAEAAADSGAIFLGTDLSKAAVKLAAKRHPGVLFFVADVHRRIYLRNGAASVLLDVFAPRNPDEFARILEPGGSVIVVIPSEAHLAEVRATFGLLDVEPEKERRVLDRFAVGFRLADRREIGFALDLPADAVRDIIEMGPNHWHRGQETDIITSEVGNENIATHASFVMLRFERTSAAD
jgi:23S rRNA (guanine745-N1)-methyltransferase